MGSCEYVGAVEGVNGWVCKCRGWVCKWGLWAHGGVSVQMEGVHEGGWVCKWGVGVQKGLVNT